MLKYDSLLHSILITLKNSEKYEIKIAVNSCVHGYHISCDKKSNAYIITAGRLIRTV